MKNGIMIKLLNLASYGYLAISILLGTFSIFLPWTLSMLLLTLAMTMLTNSILFKFLIIVIKKELLK